MDWNKIIGIPILLLGIIYIINCIKRYNRQQESFFLFTQGLWVGILILFLGLTMILGKVTLL